MFFDGFVKSDDAFGAASECITFTSSLKDLNDILWSWECNHDSWLHAVKDDLIDIIKSTYTVIFALEHFVSSKPIKCYFTFCMQNQSQWLLIDSQYIIIILCKYGHRIILAFLFRQLIIEDQNMVVSAQNHDFVGSSWFDRHHSRWIFFNSLLSQKFDILACAILEWDLQAVNLIVVISKDHCINITCWIVWVVKDMCFESFVIDFDSLICQIIFVNYLAMLSWNNFKMCWFFVIVEKVHKVADSVDWKETLIKLILLWISCLLFEYEISKIEFSFINVDFGNTSVLSNFFLLLILHLFIRLFLFEALGVQNGDSLMVSTLYTQLCFKNRFSICFSFICSFNTWLRTFTNCISFQCLVVILCPNICCLDE